MGKFYVTITLKSLRYKLCKEDVRRIFTAKRRNTPTLPAFHRGEKDQ
jgi:hypothetical protein